LTRGLMTTPFPIWAPKHLSTLRLSADGKGHGGRNTTHLTTYHIASTHPGRPRSNPWVPLNKSFRMRVITLAMGLASLQNRLGNLIPGIGALHKLPSQLAALFALTFRCLHRCLKGFCDRVHRRIASPPRPCFVSFRAIAGMGRHYGHFASHRLQQCYGQSFRVGTQHKNIRRIK